MNKAPQTWARSGGASTDGDTASRPHFDKTYNTVIQKIVDITTQELDGLTHGIVTVQLHIREGHLCRYVVSRERSVIPTHGNEEPHSERGQL